MYSAAEMNVLRNLNWLDNEHRFLPSGSAEATLVERRQTAIRAKLPESLLSFHERLKARGKPSVVPLSGLNCSACHLKLPSGVLGELRTPGRYSVCPNCSVFVWSGDPPVAEAVVLPKKTVRRKAYA
jgi:hypothetical protein